MPQRQESGFSLTELLVAIGLMTIVSAVALPSASEFLTQYQLQSASDQLAVEISRARMQAVGQNLFVRIRVEEDGYVRERSNDGTTYIADDVYMALPAGVTIGTDATGSPSFNRNGLAPIATTITVSNECGQKVIHTNILGRVTIS